MDDHRLNAELRIQSITEPPLLEPSKPRTARPIAWSILICAILCVIAAIIIPFLTKQTTLSLVLYAIGGVLTVLALIIFTRRNRPSVATVAHKSVDIFGVTRAERESIYQQATAQLEDQQAKTRQKSLYTFLALVDKCLEDETLSYEDRNKEGQRIVNKISGYIQSPPIFDPHALELTHGAFHAKSALLREEAELRFGLMQQIRDRLRAPRMQAATRTARGRTLNMIFREAPSSTPSSSAESSSIRPLISAGAPTCTKPILAAQSTVTGRISAVLPIWRTQTLVGLRTTARHR